MDKKMANILLIGAGIGLICFMAFQALSGSLSKGTVYYDPNAVVETGDQDASQTAQNYNGLGYRLISQSDNMCVSPNMIASSLGYYYEGAVDEGKEEAAIMLGTNENVKEKHAALVKELISTSQIEYDAYFTGLFMDKGTKPKEPFLKAAPYYGVYFETCDFYDFAGVKTKMDKAAAKISEGKLSQGVNDIYPSSSMVFSSVQDVKYKFSDQVGEITSSNKDFNGKQAEFITIDKAKVHYAQNDKAEYIRIPLESSYYYEITMAKGNINEITLADIKELRESAKEQTASVVMPKPQFSAYYELKEPLKNAGFAAAFDKNTIIMNLTESVRVKLDKIDHSIGYEIVANGNSKANGKVQNEVNINKSYFYSVTHKGTGMNTIMGKKS